MNHKLNLYLLLIGRTTSILGSGIYRIALPLYMLQISGSLAQMGLYFGIISIPSLVLSFYTGVFVEKHNRKYLLIGCDSLSAFLYLFLFVFLFKRSDSIFLLFFTGMLLEILNSVFSISSSVIFTELNTPNTLVKMNGLKSVSDNVANLVSPMLGTFLLGFLGFQVVVLIAGFLFLLSAIQECFIMYAYQKTICQKEETWIKKVHHGIQYVVHKKDVFYLFLLVMCLNFFVANSEEIIFPGIMIQKYKISETLYGLSSSFFIAGTILSGLYLFKRKKAKMTSLPFFFVLNSVIMVLIGFFSILLYPSRQYFYFFLVLQIISGALLIFINVPLSSYFQSHVSIAYQGRFFALLSFCSTALIPLGIIYTGFLSSLLGADVVFILNNICVIVVVAYVYKKKKIFNKT